MTFKGDLRPAVEFASGHKSIKGEDYILIQPNLSFPRPAKASSLSSINLHLSDSASSQYGILGDSIEDEVWRSPSWKSKRASELLLNAGPASFGLFCVMDGHNGKTAAEHLHNTLVSTLEERMPPGAPPCEENKAAFSSWCENVQKAIVSALTSINEEFACRGLMAGTTVTIVIQCHWLLTVANLGDSRAILDTGTTHIELSEDHRISTHQGDRRRLEAMNAHIAPISGSGSGPASKDGLGYGPLRVWPGGSCLSRGIGDFDIGPPVIACPYISQVRIPDSGGRVIIASDGVWDGFENIKKLLKISRIYNCQTVPDKLIHCLKNAYGGLRDDTSLIVLDIMPPGANFLDLVQPSRRISGSMPRRSSSSGCLCFSGNPEMVKEEEPVKPVKKSQPLQLLIQIDVAEAVGLMTTDTIKLKPSWCTEEFCKEIRSSQEAACNAWLEARSIRSLGRIPSRVDLEGFFTAVHHVQPLKESDAMPASKTGRVSERVSLEDQRKLDITTRPPPPTMHEESQHHSTRLRTSTSALSRLASEEMIDVTRGDASHHFKEHVGQPGSYPRKFGLYKAHMAENGDDGSTTEDDSHRAGSYLGSYASSPFGTPRKMSLSEDYQSPKETSSLLEEEANNELSFRRRRSQGSLDLISNGSLAALPTVEEEANPRSRSQKLEDLAAQAKNSVPTSNWEATEFAVRRGKNRFTPGGSAMRSSLDEPTEFTTPEAKAMNRRPPLPTSPKH